MLRDKDPVKKKLLIAAGALAAVYVLLVGGLFAAMLQPPDTFGQIMKHVPWPAFVVLPFESLWNVARAGQLRVGDFAPDFNLETADKTSRVQLSAHRGQRPVVLVFGSYT
jgi:hypothetical protein